MWVAVGFGTNTIAYSYNGLNWTGIGSTIFSIAGYGVSWNGTMWVAVGNGTNTIVYSYNGINWIGNGTTIFTTAGWSVAFNNKRPNTLTFQRQITVATGVGTNSIAYSYDNGLTWTGLGATIFTSNGYGIAWNGSMWVAVGTGTNTIAY